jgi:hypothetical protein
MTIGKGSSLSKQLLSRFSEHHQGILTSNMVPTKEEELPSESIGKIKRANLQEIIPWLTPNCSVKVTLPKNFHFLTESIHLPILATNSLKKCSLRKSKKNKSIGKKKQLCLIFLKLQSPIEHRKHNLKLYNFHKAKQSKVKKLCSN